MNILIGHQNLFREHQLYVRQLYLLYHDSYLDYVLPSVAGRSSNTSKQDHDPGASSNQQEKDPG